jgi:hypothetical protein
VRLADTGTVGVIDRHGVHLIFTGKIRGVPRSERASAAPSRRAGSRRRHIPELGVLAFHGEPDGAYEDAAGHGPDREIRWRV